MIPITKPLLGELELAELQTVIESGWLAQGAKVAAFERAVADYVGAQYAVAVSNCTTALHLSLRLLGIGAGDEVIVPSFSFIATANAVCYTGAKPVFVDIDPRTYNLDASLIEAAVTPRTKAIMPVHQIGLAADIDAIAGIARRHGLLLVEDAAPSLGATYKGRRVGGLGHPTCFSFHPRKVITTGEGGMIVTDDAEFAARARVLRSHGMSVSDLDRHQAKRVLIEEYSELGYNYRLSDLQAAVGLAQMKRLEPLLSTRQLLAARYREGLRQLPMLQLPYSSASQPHTYQSYMVQILDDSKISRDDVMRRLLACNIASRRGVMAIHCEPYYRALYPDLRLPVTEAASQNCLIIPLYHGLTDAEQDDVICSLTRILVG